MSRLSKSTQRFPKHIREKPESYSTVCRKRLGPTSNSSAVIKNKTRGDKSQPEMFRIDSVDSSVLKVTEGIKIFNLDQVPRKARAPKSIVPYKEMPKRQMTLKKASIFKPAVPSQSWESKPIVDELVMLKVTESHDWFWDLDMSDGSDSDSKSEKAVRDQPPSSPRLACLKSDRETRGKGNADYCQRNWGEVILPVTNNDQSAGVGGRSTKGKRPSQPNDLEKRARQVDSVRRTQRSRKEEGALKKEANKLQTAKLRNLVDQLTRD